VKKLLFAFSAIALVVASAAANFTVQIYEPSKLNGTELKPGEYKVELRNDDTAVFHQGKKTTEAPVKVETEASKFSATSVKYNNGAIQEIRLGGTNKKLVFAN
jgi:hypothetical protein